MNIILNSKNISLIELTIRLYFPKVEIIFNVILYFQVETFSKCDLVVSGISGGQSMIYA